MVCSPARKLFPAFLLIALATIVTSASAQTTITNIDQMTGWQSCSTCADTGGAARSAAQSMAQNLASPAMDGVGQIQHQGHDSLRERSVRVNGLGRKDSAHNFVFDMYYYIKTPSAAQALAIRCESDRRR